MNYTVFHRFWVSTLKRPGRRECATRRCIIFNPIFWVLLWTAWQSRGAYQATRDDCPCFVHFMNFCDTGTLQLCCWFCEMRDVMVLL